ncbi:MAG: hypothetical protein KYQ20_00320 [Candidatus Nealsonbacteria bacterium]|nr:hypothetical protein [Candidatus Nealsonbacteria bacterium]
MLEKFKGEVPLQGKEISPQEKIEGVEQPKISEHLSFLEKSVHRYRGLDQSKTEQLFRNAFEKLPKSKQKTISLELQALGIEIDTLEKQDIEISPVWRSEISNRILGAIEKSGVVASAKEGGVDRTRKQVGEVAEKAAAYLIEYETFAQSVKDKSGNTKKSVEYLLAISSGIKQELGRLQLTDVSSAQSQNELKDEREARYPVITNVSYFYRDIDNAIYMEGLIGFSTLNKLLKEFCSAKEYLEKTVLQTKAKKAKRAKK